VGQGAFICIAPVVAPADNPALVDDYAADGDFSQCIGFLCLLQGFFHVFFRNAFYDSHNVLFPSQFTVRWPFGHFLPRTSALYHKWPGFGTGYVIACRAALLRQH
jgi:hypothetical protein